MAEQLYTVPDVAKVLRMSESAVWRFVHSGQLPSRVFGRARRIAQSDLDRFIADRPDPEDTA